ncbi:Poly(ADP-ribose) glycohydrolase 1 [Hibiscus syriacus]|uniref:Poly(ADP-ribose) glycohydrolase 1 n=1 Tax=Hibiscus syriacus TaxID=106335 RepID=A0A6A2Z556_HIBSY|nr:Poly(ADP-ribose) glycohydrolase 1 [Hibiscus syriacus]
MEDNAELESVLPYLPFQIGSSSRLLWPSKVVDALEAMSKGPDHSRVHSGEVLSIAISDIRASLSLAEPLAPSAPQGYALFFDELISRADSTNWFKDDIPKLADLLLRLPFLIDLHYQNTRPYGYGLRILGPQQPGVVLLSQVICLQMPTGSVSFERKLLSLGHHPLQSCLSYPDADFWTKSTIPLCPFQVHSSGLIEDHAIGTLEVDFANKYLGGGALNRGCVQEEIRFMINPELIAGMLFLPSMADNEAIEIVGTERFSDYTGYASSFRFTGDYVDKRNVDSLGRRKTRIVAIDALCSPRMKQYKLNYLLRETNKAFCGFLYQSKYIQYKRLFKIMNSVQLNEASFLPVETNGEFRTEELGKSDEKCVQLKDPENYVGIATGNWGCGAFGGDSELKAMIQWLAASQALRPFISYYTFGLEVLQSLDQVTQWILSHKWNVGDLWNILVEYSSQKLRGETNVGFFTWLLPSLRK